MTQTADVAVVGGGILGLATARVLVARGLRVVVLEKEPRLAAHQTGHNSGVIHSGLYYRPGSLKARLATTGREAMFAYAAEKGIAHERCGKLVVAVDEHELPRLDELERRGRANGLVGLTRLAGDEIRRHEPHAAGIAGLHVAETGIVDYRAVCQALAEDLVAAGSSVRTGSELRAIARDARGLRLTTATGELAVDRLVNCAGLASDRVARLAGERPEVAIVPFRGDYYELVSARRSLVRNLIYPVPDPDLPFLGVHLTRHVDGAIEAGPNAVLSLAREGYSRTSFAPRDVAELLTNPGFWKMSVRWAGVGASELRRAWSRRAFVASLRRLVPAIADGDVERAGCGIRAQAVDRSGRLLDDFAFLDGERTLHVLNAPSPAATAALAIGEEIATRLLGTTRSPA